MGQEPASKSLRLDGLGESANGVDKPGEDTLPPLSPFPGVPGETPMPASPPSSPEDYTDYSAIETLSDLLVFTGKRGFKINETEPEKYNRPKTLRANKTEQKISANVASSIGISGNAKDKDQVWTNVKMILSQITIEDLPLDAEPGVQYYLNFAANKIRDHSLNLTVWQETGGGTKITRGLQTAFETHSGINDMKALVDAIQEAGNAIKERRYKGKPIPPTEKAMFAFPKLFPMLKVLGSIQNDVSAGNKIIYKKTLLLYWYYTMMNIGTEPTGELLVEADQEGAAAGGRPFHFDGIAETASNTTAAMDFSGAQDSAEDLSPDDVALLQALLPPVQSSPSSQEAQLLPPLP